MGNKDGSKGGYGHHHHRRAGFNLVPEYLPYDVRLRGADSTFRHAHNGDDYHHDGETEGGAEYDFLAERDLDAPDEVNWDYQYCLAEEEKSGKFIALKITAYP